VNPAFGNQTVSGVVSVQGNKALSNIIVYLENKNGSKAASSNSTHEVVQKRLRFRPGLNIVVQGDLVKFLNAENREIDHNVYSLSRVKAFDLGLAERGSQLQMTFDKSGVLNYYCSVHKLMEGRMVVLPTRHYVKLEEPGAFEITGVPSGNWTLKAIIFHRRYKTKPLDVSIADKSITNLNLSIIKK
jgi:plastocyanin